MRYIDQLLSLIAADKRIQIALFFFALIALSTQVFLYTDNLYIGHDYFFHLRRFESLVKALSNSTFPAYLDPDAIEGFGYMSNTFYPEVILIPFVPLAMIADSATVLRIIVLVMTILCGLLTYNTVNIIYKNRLIAILSALLYTFSAYRLMDIYYRTTFGEIISFTFVPIVLLGLYHIIKGDYKQKWYIIALGFTLMIFTHVLSTVMMFVTVILFLVAYSKTLWKEPKRLLYLVYAAIATILCSSYTIWPMLEQMTSQIFHYQVQTWAWTVPAVNTYSLYKTVWSLTTALPLPKQIFFPRLGLAPILFIGLRLFVKDKDGWLKNTDIITKVGFVLLLLTTSIFPWDYFPFNKLTVIQFPWRFFEFITFLFVVASSFYISRSIKSYRIIAVILLSLFVYATLLIKGERDNALGTLLGRDVTIVDNGKPHHRTNGTVGWGYEFVSDRIPSNFYFEERGDSIKTIHPQTLISNFERKNGITSLDVTTQTKDTLELPLNYYKGYIATLNGKEIPIELSNWGLIDVPIAESGHIEVRYAGTMIQQFSFYVSIISIFAVILFTLFNRKKKNHVTTI